MKESPLAVIKKLKDERYKKANVIFWSGSVAKGIGTKTSDLDIVVVYDHLPCAFREAFVFEGWPIDAFVHDKETLSYFFEQVDKPSLKPALPRMVADGIEVPGASAFSQNLKTKARALMKKGPRTLKQNEIDYKRFLITDTLDDLQSPKNRHEHLVSGMRLYMDLAEFYLSTQKKWLGNGKSLVRCLEDADAKMAERLFQAFESFFKDGKSDKVKLIADKILEPFGGTVWGGFKIKAPKDWRQ